jgi:hypothetical protein
MRGAAGAVKHTQRERILRRAGVVRCNTAPREEEANEKPRHAARPCDPSDADRFSNRLVDHCGHLRRDSDLHRQPALGRHLVLDDLGRPDRRHRSSDFRRDRLVWHTARHAGAADRGVSRIRERVRAVALRDELVLSPGRALDGNSNGDRVRCRRRGSDGRDRVAWRGTDRAIGYQCRRRRSPQRPELTLRSARERGGSEISAGAGLQELGIRGQGSGGVRVWVEENGWRVPQHLEPDTP